MSTEIWKGDNLIANASLMTVVFLDKSPRWPGIDKIDCYYFPRMTLSPLVIWEVLAGAGLFKFLDSSSLVVKEEGREDMWVRGLRYIHGRAETMKGKPTISTVLLAQVHNTGTIAVEKWLECLPGIYQEFLQIYGVEQKRG